MKIIAYSDFYPKFATLKFSKLFLGFILFVRFLNLFSPLVKEPKNNRH